MDNGAAIKRGQERDAATDFWEITGEHWKLISMPLKKRTRDGRGVFFAKCHDYVSRTSNVSRIYRWTIIIERIVSNNCNLEKRRIILGGIVIVSRISSWRCANSRSSFSSPN